MLKSRFVNGLLFAILPISYLFAYVIVGNQQGPFWWEINQDPDYAYLLSSLSFITNHPLIHTDHPGTPLQVLGGIVLKFYLTIQLGFNVSLEQITRTVLTNPEQYLQAINDTLLTITAGCFLLVGLISFQICKNLLLGLTLQTTPFLLTEMMLMNESSRVAPEVLLVCISQLLVLLSVVYIYYENVERSRWFAIALGITFGAGMATKVTFIPLLLFLLLIPEIKGRILSLIAAIAAFVVLTSPIINKYPRILCWLFKIGTHSGLYGRGQVGLMDENPMTDFSHLVSLSQIFFTLFLISIGIEVAVFLLKKRWQWDAATSIENLRFKKLYLLCILITTSIGIQILLAVKGHAQVRYLIPSASLSGCLIFALALLTTIIFSRLRLPNFSIAMTSAALVICSGIGVQQLHAASQMLEAPYKIHSLEVESIQKIIQDDQAYQGCVTVKSKRASSVDSALYFGNSWTGKNFSIPLNQIYPESVFYIILDLPGLRQYVGFNAKYTLSDLFTKGRGCVLFQADPNFFVKENLQSDLHLKKVFVGQSQALYQVMPPT